MGGSLFIIIVVSRSSRRIRLSWITGLSQFPNLSKFVNGECESPLSSCEHEYVGVFSIIFSSMHSSLSVFLPDQRNNFSLKLACLVITTCLVLGINTLCIPRLDLMYCPFMDPVSSFFHFCYLYLLAWVVHPSIRSFEFSGAWKVVSCRDCCYIGRHLFWKRCTIPATSLRSSICDLMLRNTAWLHLSQDKSVCPLAKTIRFRSI